MKAVLVPLFQEKTKSKNDTPNITIQLSHLYSSFLKLLLHFRQKKKFTNHFFWTEI